VNDTLVPGLYTNIVTVTFVWRVRLRDSGYLMQCSDWTTSWMTGVLFPTGAVKGIFISSPRPNLLWGPPNVLSNWYRRLFLRV